jgi:hypothetical protein
MGKLLNALSLLFLLCLLPCCASSQNSPSENSEQASEFIDKSKWKKLAEKYDYREKKMMEEEKEFETKKIEKKSSESLSPFVKNIITYSLFAVVILLLVFLGYRFLVGEKFLGNKKINKINVYSLEEIEHNLKEADIDSHLKNAITSGEYKLALRLYYLNLLKILTLKDAIIWKREKTNGAYLNELYGSPVYNDFLNCTEIYEFFWFNEKAVTNAEIFDKIRPHFDKTIDIASRINSKAKS